MSFGGMQHHHRFYTAPKIRSRHVQSFAGPQISRDRYQSVGTFNQPYIPLSSNQQQNSMKQSYLRINGMNSRIFTKDQLGYQGLKFEKDVINRYSQNDYQRNLQVLQKFKRQAQQLKRKKKYQHVSGKNNIKSQNYPLNDGMRSYRQQNSRVLQQSLPNHSISLLPITNKSLQKQSPNTQNKSSRKNETRMGLLPQLKLSKYLPMNNKRGIKNSKDPVIEQDQYNDQNQFLNNNENLKESPFLSRVCDVGVNAHLQIDNQPDIHRRRISQKLSHNESRLMQRKKSQYLKLQMLKSKNKHLKKKYDRLKKQLNKRSKQLLRQHKQQQEQLNDQQFQDKIENLSQMIHNLCDRLKQNNTKLLGKVTMKNEYTNNSRLKDILPSQQSRTIKIRSQYPQNQTQINLPKPPIDDEVEQAEMSKLLRVKYLTEIEKINNFRKTKPKIVYTFNKDTKNFNIDPLRLLKNKLKQQQFNKNMPINDYYVSRRRIKTQQS